MASTNQGQVQVQALQAPSVLDSLSLPKDVLAGVNRQSTILKPRSPAGTPVRRTRALTSSAVPSAKPAFEVDDTTRRGRELLGQHDLVSFADSANVQRTPQSYYSIQRNTAISLIEYLSKAPPSASLFSTILSNYLVPPVTSQLSERGKLLSLVQSGYDRLCERAELEKAELQASVRTEEMRRGAVFEEMKRCEQLLCYVQREVESWIEGDDEKADEADADSGKHSTVRTELIYHRQLDRLQECVRQLERERAEWIEVSTGLALRLTSSRSSSLSVMHQSYLILSRHLHHLFSIWSSSSRELVATSNKGLGEWKAGWRELVVRVRIDEECWRWGLKRINKQIRAVREGLKRELHLRGIKAASRPVTARFSDTDDVDCEEYSDDDGESGSRQKEEGPDNPRDLRKKVLECPKASKSALTLEIAERRDEEVDIPSSFDAPSLLQHLLEWNAFMSKLGLRFTGLDHFAIVEQINKLHGSLIDWYLLTNKSLRSIGVIDTTPLSTTTTTGGALGTPTVPVALSNDNRPAGIRFPESSDIDDWIEKMKKHLEGPQSLVISLCNEVEETFEGFRLRKSHSSQTVVKIPELEGLIKHMDHWTAAQLPVVERHFGSHDLKQLYNRSMSIMTSYSRALRSASEALLGQEVALERAINDVLRDMASIFIKLATEQTGNVTIEKVHQKLFQVQNRLKCNLEAQNIDPDAVKTREGSKMFDELGKGVKQWCGCLAEMLRRPSSSQSRPVSSSRPQSSAQATTSDA